MSDEPLWVEAPWSGDPRWTLAEVQMGGFVVRVRGIKGLKNWWWEIFHREQHERSLVAARGGSNMTEQGAKDIALGVLGVAIYADGVT